MDVSTPRNANRFRSPANWFSVVDAQAAAALLAASSDITMIVDRAGIVQDVAIGTDDFYALDLEGWIGRSWSELVAIDSRQKTHALVQEATADTKTRWREINLLAADGTSIPVNCTAVRLSDDGDVVVFGRDLATVARLQQRVVEIQRVMEADYARLRNAETRYRVLFQMAREPVVVVDAQSGRIVEANPAAAKLVGALASRLIDRPFRDLFEPSSHPNLQAALMAARTLGRAHEARLRLAGAAADTQMTASQYRHDNQQYFLVRLGSGTTSPTGSSQALEILRKFPEAVVVVEPDGRIVEANAAFLDLAELSSLEAVRGEPIDRWLGRPGIDFGLIASSLRDHGTIRDFATVLRGEYGATEDVDVTAVSVPDGETPCIGMVIRGVRRRSALPVVRDAGLSPTVENLTHLVGTMPLKDLVRETTDMIEQMCIEAALKLTDDNRASAAQILGLSRQSLYAKLHRFGLGDLSPEPNE